MQIGSRRVGGRAERAVFTNDSTGFGIKRPDRRGAALHEPEIHGECCGDCIRAGDGVPEGSRAAAFFDASPLSTAVGKEYTGTRFFHRPSMNPSTNEDFHAIRSPGASLYRKRPEIVPANKHLSLERNVQQSVCKCLTASECDKQPLPDNQFHRVSSIPSPKEIGLR